MIQAIPGKPPASLGRPQDAWIAWAGRIGLFAFALFYQLNPTVSYVGLGLMLVVFILQSEHWMPILKRDSVVQVYLGLVGFILGYALWAAHEFPETASAQWVAVVDWMHWLAFIPVAWVVRENKKHLNTLLLLLVVGVLVRILIHVEWGQIANIFQWPRMGFGLTETVFAPLAGISALGLLLLAPRIISGYSRPWLGWMVGGLWLAGLVIILQALVLSQTRGVWLAAAIAFPIGLAVRYQDWLRGQSFKSAKTLSILGLAASIAGLFILLNAGFFIHRIQSEPIKADPAVVNTVIEGEKKIITTTAISYRLIMWRIGAEKWLERPLLGWGPGTSEYLLQQSDNPLLKQRVTLQDGTEYSPHLPHLHSVYLEALVRFGALGAILFFALPVMLLRGVWKAYSQGAVPWDYACFLLAGWGFTAILSAFDFQIFKFAWRNYCVIWAGLSYAVYLENLLQARAAGINTPAEYLGK